MAGRIAFLLSFPERAVRSVFALVGGGVHETAELVLPRLVRRSRLYEATAKNLLRVSIEVVGGVEAPAGSGEYEPDAGRLIIRKTAGNVVELGSIAAFGFSPLWLLAAGADVTHGTRVYLDAFVQELKVAGVLAEAAQSRPASESRSSTPGGISAASTSSIRTARILRPSAMRGSGDTRRASRDRTARLSPGISTLSARA